MRAEREIEREREREREQERERDQKRERANERKLGVLGQRWVETVILTPDLWLNFTDIIII
jgi:hypothetical protein